LLKGKLKCLAVGGSLYIHSFIQFIFIAPIQVHYYSEALPTEHGYCARISRRSATGNCEWRTIPGSLRGGYSGSRNRDSSDERRRLDQCATHAPHYISFLLCCGFSVEAVSQAIWNMRWSHNLQCVIISRQNLQQLSALDAKT